MAGIEKELTGGCEVGIFTDYIVLWQSDPVIKTIEDNSDFALGSCGPLKHRLPSFALFLVIFDACPSTINYAKCTSDSASPEHLLDCVNFNRLEAEANPLLTSWMFTNS
ncbi:hypothetical protein CEXT_659881 [Caerostris extrusa]|uniref:Uncharacterized protein n=1 Tax=Caerostris extrusa TaxID=172846 RepID=A0AAV4MCV8_CAEEX|nr:hypothetical protein CEXT_659881 [Caerostris extrusa]